MAKSNNNPTEEQEQRTLIEWCRLQEGMYPELALLFHIPNEGPRTKSYGFKLKLVGLRPGVPDLFLPVARGCKHGLFIEMKRIGEKPNEDQIEWLEKLKLQGYEAVVAQGWEEASEVIKKYIKLK